MTQQQTILKLADDFHLKCYNCEQRLDITGLEPFAKLLCSSCDAEITIPFPFHNYLLEDIIGTGSTGTVYRALDYSLNREVAIKILDQERSNNPEQVEVFIAASQKTATINNPNIITVFSSGDSDNTPYVVTEFIPSGSLSNYLTQYEKIDDQKVVLKIAKQLSGALAEIHSNDLIYSDFSPRDIFITEDMDIKLSDIGFANLRWEQSHLNHYTSPERDAKSMVSELSDIYSLGVILYQITTGYIPFHAESDAELYENKLNGLTKTPKELNPKVDSKLSDLIVSMLSAEPQNRPKSTNEILTILNTIKVKNMSGKTFHNSSKPKSTIKRPVKKQSSNGVIKLFLALFVVTFIALGADFMRGKNSMLFAEGKPLHPLAVKINGEQKKPKSKNTVVVSVGDIIKDTVPELKSEKKTQKTDSSETVTAVEEETTVEKETKKRRTKTLPRPRPKGIDFPKRKKDLAKYIASFSEDLQVVEKARINIIAEARPELSKLLSSNPYQPSGKIIVLRKLSENKLLEERCISVKGNSSEIILMKPKGETMHLKWSQVPLKQLVTFYEYYIQQRLDLVDIAPSEDHKAAIHDSAVESTFRVSLLTDWYGDTDLAKLYAKKVLKLSPKHKPALKKFLPYLFK